MLYFNPLISRNAFTFFSKNNSPRNEISSTPIPLPPPPLQKNHSRKILNIALRGARRNKLDAAAATVARSRPLCCCSLSLSLFLHARMQRWIIPVGENWGNVKFSLCDVLLARAVYTTKLLRRCLYFDERAR